MLKDLKNDANDIEIGEEGCCLGDHYFFFYDRFCKVCYDLFGYPFSYIRSLFSYFPKYVFNAI